MKLLKKPLKIKLNPKLILTIVLILGLIGATAYSGYRFYGQNSLVASLNQKTASESGEIQALKSRDEYKINQDQKAEIDNIHKTYADAGSSYEKLLDLKAIDPKQGDLDKLFAQSLKYLSDQNYASASATLTDLNSQIETQTLKNAPPPPTQAAQATASAPSSNTPPGSGYSRQSVHTDAGDFTLDIIAADLNSTKVIVDTASSSDCPNNCPVMPLAYYANRNGAIAAINGPFFCPDTYPQCAGKTNSFDTLLMNKDKTYFNSSNNVYSTIPAVIFHGTEARFVSQSLEWGRDTGVDSVIANYPMLVLGDNITFTENPNEPKFGARGARCFIGATGSTVYIGTIYNATMGEAAKVIKALKINSALNLDEGGSTALWYQGRYLTGPGRNLPNAVLLVNR